MSCPCPPCQPCPPPPPQPPPCGQPCPPPPPPPMCHNKPPMRDMHYKQCMGLLRNLFVITFTAGSLFWNFVGQKRIAKYAAYKKENDFEEQAVLMGKQGHFKAVESEEEIKARKKKAKK